MIKKIHSVNNLFQRGKIDTMKFSISTVFSMLFRISLIFLISFIWARYYIDSLYLAIFVSALATIMIDIFIKLLSTKHQTSLSLKKKELEKIEDCRNSFLFGEEKQTLDFYYKLAKSKHEATKKKEYILIEHDNGEKIVLFPFYTYRKFAIDDLIFCINKIKNIGCTKLVICTNEYDGTVNKFADKISLNILILNCEQTYLKLLKVYDFYPEKIIELKTSQKNSIKDLLAYSLNKKRTKGYFLASCIMLFSSFLVKYNIYYIIFSTLLLILSLISFINPKFNKKISENVL